MLEGVCHFVHRSKILPDFTRVDTEFLVQKTTGEIIDKHRPITGT